MITVSDLGMQFAGSVLFQHADLQFTAGNCYGVIGANGSGKSTFLRILSGELEPTKGYVAIKPGIRMSVITMSGRVLPIISSVSSPLSEVPATARSISSHGIILMIMLQISCSSSAISTFSIVFPPGKTVLRIVTGKPQSA